MDLNIQENINNRDLLLREISDINAIIIHHTASSALDKDILNYLYNSKEVSCHYLVNTNGGIYHLVDDDRIAYHAGRSKYKGLVSKNNSLNWCTLGIEVHSDGYSFTKTQKRNTFYLIKNLMDKYNVSADMIVRHKDISLSGKWDIGDNFWNDMFDSWQSYQKKLFDFKINNMDEKQKKAMEAVIATNSMAWYDVDEETKKKLESLNKFLKKKMV